MKDWKTSLCGILVVVAGYISGHASDFPSVVALIAAGVGLIFSKDASWLAPKK